MRVNGNISVPDDRLEAFCRKWKIVELALFGSVLRDDFDAESDVDVLVTFEDDAPWSLWDIVHMGDDLEQLLGRKVDIAERSAIEQSENYIRRRRILESARTIYAA